MSKLIFVCVNSIYLHNHVLIVLQPVFLFRMGVSHVSLCMKPNGDIFVYKNRGRPTTEEVVLFSFPKKMKKELKRMKKEMSFKDETEILLAISVASDDMIRSVHMFPEVFYMDVTANTKKQKRDLFLMVVKVANGETFIWQCNYYSFWEERGISEDLQHIFPPFVWRGHHWT